MDDKLVKKLTDTELAIAEVEQKMSLAVVDFKNQLVDLKEKETELHEAVRLSMEKSGVKKFDNAFLTVTYVAPSTRTSIDVTRLKAELPEMAEKYSKTTEVKSSVRIKVKETK